MLFSGFGWLALITYYLWMPLGALILWRQSSGRYVTLGLSRYPGYIRHILVGMAGAAGAVLAVFVLMRASGWIEIADTGSNLPKILASILVQQAVVAALEELTFRGVIQQLLVARFAFLRGLVGTSAAFGFFHLPNILVHDVPTEMIPLTVLNLTLMGLVFGWAFQQTGHHLALPIALHWGWNVACFGLVESQTLRFSGWIAGVPDWFPESGLSGTVGLVAVGWLVWRLTTGRE
jgi:membrane protease YdiL (CAAX protease family)